MDNSFANLAHFLSSLSPSNSSHNDINGKRWYDFAFHGAMGDAVSLYLKVAPYEGYSEITIQIKDAERTSYRYVQVPLTQTTAMRLLNRFAPGEGEQAYPMEPLGEAIEPETVCA